MDNLIKKNKWLKDLKKRFTETDIQMTDKPRKFAQHRQSSGKFKVIYYTPTQMAKIKELATPRVTEKAEKPDFRWEE